jgi:hypothetical protein
MTATYLFKPCAECGEVFKANSTRKKYCPKCLALRKRASQERFKQKLTEEMKKRNYLKKPSVVKPTKKKAPVLSIMGVCRLLKKYNEDNGVYLSYGEFVQMIDSGKIKVTVTEGAVNYVKKD